MNTRSFKKLVFALIVLLIGFSSGQHFFKKIAQYENQLLKPIEVDVIQVGGVSASRRIEQLPHLLQHQTSSLRTYHIRIKLPSLDHLESQGTGFFSPQILHGGEYYLNGQIIHREPGSSLENRYAWYQPLWFSLPTDLLHIAKDNFIDIKMHSFQRGFIVPSIYFAPTKIGHYLYRVYYFIGTTLANATNLFSWLAGLFMLSIWLLSDNSKPGRLFAFAGSSTFLWATLFTLALWPDLPMDLWKTWRFFLYISTGGLVFLMSMFIFEYASTRLPKKLFYFILLLTFTPPLLFLIPGNSIEFFLDVYWTGAMITLYVVAIGNLIIRFKGRFDLLTMALFVHSIVATVFAYHDYGVQSGPMLTQRAYFLKWGIPSILLEPIYLSHLSLPTPLIISAIILVRHHILNLDLIKNSNETLQQQLRNREEELSAIYIEQQKFIKEHAVNEERNRIFQDIHDGLGSRLINIIVGLRSNQFKRENLLLDLQSCLSDLRLLVDGQSLSETSLSEILKELVQRTSRNMLEINCRLCYHFESIEPGQVSNEVGLAILRISQEMISNIIKHASATEASIVLVWSPLRTHLILKISDNGVGFDIENLQLQLKRGIKGINQRLKGTSDHFELISQPGMTCLLAHFPTLPTSP